MESSNKKESGLKNMFNEVSILSEIENATKIWNDGNMRFCFVRNERDFYGLLITSDKKIKNGIVTNVIPSDDNTVLAWGTDIVSAWLNSRKLFVDAQGFLHEDAKTVEKDATFTNAIYMHKSTLEKIITLYTSGKNRTLKYEKTLKGCRFLKKKFLVDDIRRFIEKNIQSGTYLNFNSKIMKYCPNINKDILLFADKDGVMSPHAKNTPNNKNTINDFVIIPSPVMAEYFSDELIVW